MKPRVGLTKTCCRLGWSLAGGFLLVGSVIALLLPPVGSFASATVDGRWEGKWTRTGGSGCKGVTEGNWVGDFTRGPDRSLRYQMWDQFFIFNAPVLAGEGITDEVEAVRIRYVDKSTRGISTSTIVYEGVFQGGALSGTWTLDSRPGAGVSGCQLSGTWSGTHTQPQAQQTQQSATESVPQQTIAGPSRTNLEGGGQLDVKSGGRVLVNSPTNFHVESGLMHLRERLARFKCPAGYEPFSKETTLSSWIGARCRNVTTPHAGALLKGTEFSVEVSSDATVFRVFEGALEVSDLARGKIVLVAANQSTTVSAGGGPSDPVPFDPSSVERWWDGGPPVAAVMFIGLGLVGLYFLPLILALILRRRLWWVVLLVDLFTAWTIIGWIVAMVLASVLGSKSSPAITQGGVLADAGHAGAASGSS